MSILSHARQNSGGRPPASGPLHLRHQAVPEARLLHCAHRPGGYSTVVIACNLLYSSCIRFGDQYRKCILSGIGRLLDGAFPAKLVIFLHVSQMENIQIEEGDIFHQI